MQLKIYIIFIVVLIFIHRLLSVVMTAGLNTVKHSQVFDTRTHFDFDCHTAVVKLLRSSWWNYISSSEVFLPLPSLSSPSSPSLPSSLLEVSHLKSS